MGPGPSYYTARVPTRDVSILFRIYGRKYTNSNEQHCVTAVRTILHANWHCLPLREWSNKPVSATDGWMGRELKSRYCHGIGKLSNRSLAFSNSN